LYITLVPNHPVDIRFCSIFIVLGFWISSTKQNGIAGFQNYEVSGGDWHLELGQARCEVVRGVIRKSSNAPFYKNVCVMFCLLKKK
jgi:hypothetical protein